jgi:hypothetical protein
MNSIASQELGVQRASQTVLRSPQVQSLECYIPLVAAVNDLDSKGTVRRVKQREAWYMHTGDMISVMS